MCAPATGSRCRGPVRVAGLRHGDRLRRACNGIALSRSGARVASVGENASWVCLQRDRVVAVRCEGAQW